MKKSVLLIACFSLMILMVACGGEKAVEAPAENSVAPTQASAPSPIIPDVDNRYFSLKLAEGWKAGPLTSGMVNILPQGKYSPGLYFKFEGDGNAAGTAEASIKAMISEYSGSPMEDAVFAGTTFKSTTYTYGGSPQTMHVAFRDGTKVTITIEGKDGKDNPDIQAMLKTLVLK